MNKAKSTGIFYFYSLIIIHSKNITMGRGDKKTAKGKRFQGSFGKSRPAKTTKSKKPVAVKAS
ncbi:MAG: 30S ribosomal protein THX [Bacteroidota bacterium]